MDQLLPLDDVERVDAISREDFVERFVKPGKPVVIRGLATQWPAWSKWTPGFFGERFGDKPVIVKNSKIPVEGGGHRAHYGGLVEMTMREYIAKIMTSDEDLRLGARHTLELAQALEGDYAFPDLGRGWSRRLLWLFFGTRTARTPLHFDFGPFHVLHTCFLGKKTVCLFPQSQSHALHRPAFTARSPVNPHAPDFERFPRLRGIQGWRVVIDRGDTLYMPAGVWHDVRYHEPSIAFTQRFTEGARFVAARVLGQLAVGAVSDALSRLAPRTWPQLQERLS